jgi:hypothetical protein
MKIPNKNSIFLIFLTSIPIVSLFIGFALNEDLSTGGATYDFNLTWPIIIDYSNFNFTGTNGHIPTTHMPLHYALLSLVYAIFNDQYLVRFFYLFFSLLLPNFFIFKSN